MTDKPKNFCLLCGEATDSLICERYDHLIREKRDLTPEEADAAYDEADLVPVSEEEAERIVAEVLRRSSDTPKLKTEARMDYAELHGDEEIAMYRLRYIGGPKDGEVGNSFRPYDAMQHPEGVYAAHVRGEACLIWVDDWTRDIELHFQGEGTTFKSLGLT